MLPRTTQAALRITPDVPQSDRVMRIISAYIRVYQDLKDTADALQKYHAECGPLLQRGGGFEQRSKQVCRWLAEMRAVEVVGGQHEATIAVLCLKIATFLVGEEMAKKTADLAEALQRKKISVESSTQTAGSVQSATTQHAVVIELIKAADDAVERLTFYKLCVSGETLEGKVTQSVIDRLKAASGK